MFNLFNLLTESGDTANNQSGSMEAWIMPAILFVLLIAFMIYSNYAQKKKQKEAQETLNALKPGNKVKTIGGICGIVVEVCEEDNTFVLETGTEKSGKSYIKFDKQAVYQTDAASKKEDVKTEKVDEKVEAKEEPKADEKAE